MGVFVGDEKHLVRTKKPIVSDCFFLFIFHEMFTQQQLYCICCYQPVGTNKEVAALVSGRSFLSKK